MLYSSKRDEYNRDKIINMGCNMELYIFWDSVENVSNKNANNSGYRTKNNRTDILFFKHTSSESVVLCTPNILVINDANKSVAEFLI